MTKSRRLLIVTDLDRTLLSSSYDYHGVVDTLEKLKMLKVPVIPVTSRTFKELELYMRKIPLGELDGGIVAVVEVGGAIHASEHLVKGPKGSSNKIVEIPLAQRLESVSKLIDESIREAMCSSEPLAFTKATTEEIASETGLTPIEARFAKMRSYDETLVFQDARCKRRFIKAALKRGLDVVESIRHVHVGLGIGKERGLLKLIKVIPRFRMGRLTTICLGDSPMDRRMLESCNIAIVIPWDDRVCRVMPRGKHVIISPYPAPRGWSWAIEKVLALQGAL